MRVHQRAWMFGLVVTTLCVAAPVQGADLDKYLPDNAEVVFTINFRQILDSAVVQKYARKEVETGIKGNKDVQELLKLLGLDPLKDVTSLTIAGPAQADETKAIAIVRGSFDLAKIHEVADKFAKANAAKLIIHKLDGIPLYEVRDENLPKPAFAAFLNKEVLVIAGNKTPILNAIAKSTGKIEFIPGKKFQALVREQDSKQSLWIAILASNDIKKQLIQNAQNDKMKVLAEKLESVSGGVTLTDEIKVQLRIQTSDPQAAKDIRQQLEGAKALGILAANAEQLKDYAAVIMDVLNSIKFAQKEGTVSVEVTVPANLIEKAIKK